MTEPYSDLQVVRGSDDPSSGLEHYEEHYKPLPDTFFQPQIDNDTHKEALREPIFTSVDRLLVDAYVA